MSYEYNTQKSNNKNQNIIDFELHIMSKDTSYKWFFKTVYLDHSTAPFSLIMFLQIKNALFRCIFFLGLSGIKAFITLTVQAILENALIQVLATEKNVGKVMRTRSRLRYFTVR